MKKLSRLFATLAIPLSVNSGWQPLKYGRYAPTKLSINESQIQLSLKNSSGYLIYELPAVSRVTGFHIKAKFKGSMRPTKDKFPNDAYLRIGLVAEGDRKLKWAEKQKAADWVRQLFSLVPRNTGINKVYFFNAIDRRDALMAERELADSNDLIWEKNIGLREPEQETLSMDYTLPKALDVVAIWLGADADGSQSTFDVFIESLDLIVD